MSILPDSRNAVQRARRWRFLHIGIWGAAVFGGTYVALLGDLSLLATLGAVVVIVAAHEGTHWLMGKWLGWKVAFKLGPRTHYQPAVHCYEPAAPLWGRDYRLIAVAPIPITLVLSAIAWGPLLGLAATFFFCAGDLLLARGVARREAAITSFMGAIP